MVKYTISFENPSTQYIHLELEFTTTETTHEIQLPSWRPGRYELGNFAKNVKNFKVNSNKLPIPFLKIAKDRWKIDCEKNQTIKIEYDYFASELNAGSTYLSDKQLYVNPVNCCMYIEGFQNSPFTLSLIIPDTYEIACGLEQNGNILSGNSFDELADSPFICSNTLQLQTYESHNTLFHIWFQGEVKPQWEKVINDFKKFTDKQIEKFGDFPVSEYHFLIQISSYRTYHGVEHKTSTVIHLGPSFDIFGDVYSDLLGVSSHELYHTWNVKSIRPIEMFPYDYTKENYSTLGFLCEGVTTYMGDLMLLKSGVFSFEEYKQELTTQIQKHFDNIGRLNYSVTESSYDTWLDGYVPGAPGRKTSIYTEGCLISFFLDVKIIKNSNCKYSLDDVMLELYNEFYKKNKGVSESDYKQVLEKYVQEDLTEFWSNYVTGREDFKKLIIESLDILGLKLDVKPSKESEKIGIKTLFNGNSHVIKSIFPKSNAQNSMLFMDDEIIAINTFEVKNDLEKWLEYFKNENLSFLVKRKNQFITIEIKREVDQYFENFHILVESKNNSYFNKWIS